MRVQHCVLIKCAPEVVFGWIEDPERARQWQPDVAAQEVLHDEPGMVGTEFREVLADGGKHVHMHGRITEFTPNTSMAVLLKGEGMTVTARYKLNAHPAGTLLQVQQSLSLPGRLAKLLEPLIRRRVATRARADLCRLKNLCENDTS